MCYQETVNYPYISNFDRGHPVVLIINRLTEHLVCI